MPPIDKSRTARLDELGVAAMRFLDAFVTVEKFLRDSSGLIFQTLRYVRSGPNPAA